MFEKLIPTAYAQYTQQVKTTAVAGKDAAVDSGKAGLEGLVSYVFGNVDNWIAGALVIVASYLIAKMVAATVQKTIKQKKGGEVHESVMILIERMTIIVIVTIGVTIAAAINGLNFTAVIGAMSLGIGFALKDIIGNFISGLIMLSQDRIRIGDFIKVNDILGTIESIDTRATILQAVDGTEVVIPNQTMLNETLVSYSTNPFRRIELNVGVDYNTNLPMVTSLVRGILDKDKDIVPKPEPLVLVEEFGDSSINLRILFWIESSKSWMHIKSNLANRIKKAFDEMNINIPFPITTLKIDENDRSFLQTMDSMKKGVVPQPNAVPSRDAVMAAAEGTVNEPNLPEKIFGERVVAEPNNVETINKSSTKEAQATPAEPIEPPPTQMRV